MLQLESFLLMGQSYVAWVSSCRWYTGVLTYLQCTGLTYIKQTPNGNPKHIYTLSTNPCRIGCLPCYCCFYVTAHVSLWLKYFILVTKEMGLLVNKKIIATCEKAKVHMIQGFGFERLEWNHSICIHMLMHLIWLLYHYSRLVHIPIQFSTVNKWKSIESIYSA